jgi:beta-lactamase regulating signal transducer with metallopeptidase domain
MRVEELVVAQVVQITILVCVVWTVTQTITRRHAHLSYALWLVVLLKCVTPPIWSSPVGAFSWAFAGRSELPHEIVDDTQARVTAPFVDPGPFALADVREIPFH